MARKPVLRVRLRKPAAPAKPVVGMGGGASVSHPIQGRNSS
jgi:hypothetical protein